ncbi:unnamed protein product [Durusdinium trenchii]|uniref:RRM domain-containing protein n=2 Tax=Durusdinium trenchii TaxID=1381693 RepID=A0ABP0PCK1_9DINO
MWSGGTRTTSTEQSLTIYVTNIPDNVTVADVSALFSKDEGFCGLRAVGGSKRIVFVDFGTEMQATKAMRKHQGHCFLSATEGLMIDFDHDKRSKRSRAIEKPWSTASFDRGRNKRHEKPMKRKRSREREAEMFQRERARSQTSTSGGTELEALRKDLKTPKPPSYLKTRPFGSAKPEPTEASQQCAGLVAYSSSESEESRAESERL